MTLGRPAHVALNLAALALASLTSSAASAAHYRHPSECGDGCMIVTAYRDHGGNTDWSCGSNTYGGHGGTDFGIFGGFAAVDEGRPVVAAANGTVVQANDGEFDRCTTGNCSGGGGFGNYVAIQHDDGVITFYGHMRQGSVAVGVGDVVGCGQFLGFIASSGASTGPHVHFEPRAGSSLDPFEGPCGDGAGSSWVSQGAYNALPAPTCEGPANSAPFGYIDSATCDGVVGWATDPDSPDAAIAVHIYVDGEAGSGARGFPIVAGDYRDDLCQALGTCNHGYAFSIPNVLRDGVAHTAFAYGIDTAGGDNPLLTGSGASFTCGPPAIDGDGVLRHVASEDVMSAWSFGFDDVAAYPALDEDIVGDWPLTRRVIQASGAPEVYVVDGDVKRHITSPESLAAWRLSADNIEIVDADTVASFSDGADLPFAPLLVRVAGDPAVYVLDALPLAAAAGEGEGDGGNVGPGDGNEGDGEGDGGEGDGANIDGAKPGSKLPPSVAESCASTSSSSALVSFALLALLARVRRRLR